MKYADLKEHIERYEGRRYTPYTCPAGKITIGVGRNLEDNPLSDREVDLLLRNDILRCLVEFNSIFSPGARRKLSNNRKMVIVDMLFVLGKGRFLTFKKFIAAINSYDYNQATLEIVDSKFYHQVGNRGVKLVQLMREG